MAEQSKAFDVFQNRRDPIFRSMSLEKIDTVFYSNKHTPAEVRRELIEHDGYDTSIIVRRGT